MSEVPKFLASKRKRFTYFTLPDGYQRAGRNLVMMKFEHGEDLFKELIIGGELNKGYMISSQVCCVTRSDKEVKMSDCSPASRWPEDNAKVIFFSTQEYFGNYNISGNYFSRFVLCSDIYLCMLCECHVELC